MNFYDYLLKNANSNATIILPESEDERILNAISFIRKNNITNIILIGDSKEIINKCNLLNINLYDIEIISPLEYFNIDKMAEQLIEYNKDISSYKEAYSILTTDYVIFACMLLNSGIGTGIATGASHTTLDTIRTALKYIKVKENLIASSSFLMDIPNRGIYIFSDCAFNVNPNVDQLVEIANSAAAFYEKITNNKSHIAMLSYSTHNSGKGESVDKVKQATEKLLAENYLVEGEIQADVALSEIVSKNKNVEKFIDANTLIFPNIDAGNISYKLVSNFANAKAYGPLLHGFKKPINDLSRGANVEEIIGVIAITSMEE